MTTGPELTAPLWSVSTLIRGIPCQAPSEEALLSELGLLDPSAWDDAGVLRTAAARIRDHLVSTPSAYRELVRSVLYRIEDAQAEVCLRALKLYR